MIADLVRVQRFRSIVDGSLALERVVALVGANGSGKSCFLRAVELFYEGSTVVSVDDFYNRDLDQPISIAITFSQLSPAARERFAKYIQGETLTVERVFHNDSGKIASSLHGSTLQHALFDVVREGDSAAAKKTAYNELRTRAEYGSLPPYQNGPQAATAIREWEAAHPTACERKRDDGKFFGFQNVAEGFLGEFTKFIFVSAVRDAKLDAAEAKGSVFTELMDLVVRSIIANLQALEDLRQTTQSKLREILDPNNRPELSALSTELTSTLQALAPSSSVNLRWLPIATLEIPIPKAEIRLSEDGYETTVERTGHGLQRAFILTMLQHLASARDRSGEGGGGEGEELPDLIFAIEEPELYQHPTRQRHLDGILQKLAQGGIPGVSRRMQVLYCTHSPYFVAIDRAPQIRLLRKVGGDGAPKATSVVSCNLDRVAERIWRASGASGPVFTAASLTPRLTTLMRGSINEGFFANVVVLVEGEEDRALIVAAAQHTSVSLDALGIAVIQCGGKGSIDRPLGVFSELGIPVYAVWDGDKPSRVGEADNRRLLALLGLPPEDWPPTSASATHAVFEDKLETTVQAELGEEFTPELAAAQAEFGFKNRQDAIKNPHLLQDVFRRMMRKGRTSDTLEGIIKSVLALGS